ncbi:MAG: hypothetical protein PVJ57_20935 [Phycisphaerae bacterium]
MIRSTLGMLLLGLVVSPAALADTTYVLQPPDLEFVVLDVDPFDGIGNRGPFDGYQIAAWGSIGEKRTIAEYDISNVSVPAGETIVSATFTVECTNTSITGLGINGQTPERFALDGYLGNGVADLSDFQAGNGNVLDTVDTPDLQVGDVLTFDVTSYVANLVDAGQDYVGLTLRADWFGAASFDYWYSGGELIGTVPTLAIQTAVPEPGTLSLCVLAASALLRRRSF